MAGKESWDGERGMGQERSGRRREARARIFLTSRLHIRLEFMQRTWQAAAAAVDGEPAPALCCCCA